MHAFSFPVTASGNVCVTAIPSRFNDAKQIYGFLITYSNFYLSFLLFYLYSAKRNNNLYRSTPILCYSVFCLVSFSVLPFILFSLHQAGLLTLWLSRSVNL